MENPLGFFVLACFPDLWELAVWPHDEQQQSLRAEFYTKINADKFAWKGNSGGMWGGVKQ